VRIDAIFVCILVNVIDLCHVTLFISNVICQGKSCDYDVVLSDFARAWSRDCDVAQFDCAAIPEPSLVQIVVKIS
jgi:hypothetical protein